MYSVGSLFRLLMFKQVTVIYLSFVIFDKDTLYFYVEKYKVSLLRWSILLVAVDLLGSFHNLDSLSFFTVHLLIARD